MKTNNYAGIDPHIVNVIEREAEKLRGRFGLAAADLDDMRQDLHVGVWKALGGLAPDVNREAAVNRIVGNLVRDLIRHRQRSCRDWRSAAVSIDAPCDEADDGGDETLGDVADLEAMRRSAMAMPASWHERRGEKTDFAEVLGGLSSDLRELADMLDSADGNLSGVARALGLSRKQSRTLIGRLQRSLEVLRADSGERPIPATPREKRENEFF
jgi:DNA-directed RNA polymerase specialized sigma24 family protein